MIRSLRTAALAVAVLAGLVVAVPRAEAAPSAPVVQIESPGSLAPALVPAGGAVAVRFSVDRNATWQVGYRSAGSSGGFSAFPASGGRAKGSVTAGVQAPVKAGIYDLAVTATAAGRTARAVVVRGLVVTGPAIMPSGRCDALDPTACLLPFPNDVFTGADPTTDTGRRVNLSVASTPRNVAGLPIDPTEWNRNDGFSPGSTVLAQVPDVDLHATWGSSLDHIQDLSWYQRADAPIVLLDADTGDRHPFWSELNSHATEPSEQLLILRPAVNLTEGHRYIVAMRQMRRHDGSLIPAGPKFASYRDKKAIGARAAHMESLFTSLKQAGVGRENLFLAWDFTVASERNLSERALHIRDDAFAALGDNDLSDGRVRGASPRFSITKVIDHPGEGTMRRIEGTVSVPNYLTPQAIVTVPDPVGEPLALPQSRFHTLGSPTGLPSVNPLQPAVDVEFVCNIPSGADANPADPMLYGHGLLGGRSEANGSSTAALRREGFAPCAVDWWGMSFSDLPNVALVLTDLSRFPSVADRSQQGFLNFMYLGRALIHPDGLRSDPAFRAADGSPLLSDDLVYDGNSQGGIMGGALVALAPDLTRAKLGVPGMNYSTLLNRSSDWEPAEGSLVDRLPGLDPTDPTSAVAYGDAYTASYPGPIDQMLGYALLQMLWDRAEANGYAHHLTDDPLANTPAHQVLLQVAFSDHQVANVAAEVMGRTAGVRLRVPSVPNKMHWSVDPTFGFRTWNARKGALKGASALVYWLATDRGLTTPPNGNEPPRVGGDPHSDPRKDIRGAAQTAHFLRTGEIIDVCAGGPCLTSAASR